MELEEMREKTSLDLAPGTCLLDIETTGLSRDRDRPFLLGLLIGRTDGGSDCLQIYDPSGGKDPSLQEALVLKAAQYLEDREVISYNGRAFDLPFLEASLKRAGLPPLKYTSSFDIYAWLRARRRLLAGDIGPLANLEKEAGFIRKDRLSGQAVASSAALMANREVADLVLGHNRDDLEGSWHLLGYLEGLRDSLRTELNDSRIGPCRLELTRLEKSANQARAFFSLDPAQAIKGFANSSFGQLTWSGRNLVMTLSLKGGYIQGQKVRLAASPTPFRDRSPYAFRPPLFAVYDEKRDYGDNLLLLAKALLKK